MLYNVTNAWTEISETADISTVENQGTESMIVKIASAEPTDNTGYNLYAPSDPRGPSEISLNTADGSVWVKSNAGTTAFIQ